MPERKTIERARKAEKEGKSPSTAAGEFVREEIEHVRRGKHGARSPKQAIAIGLSKARRAGVPLPSPRKATASKRTRRKAESDLAKGKRPAARTSPRRASASKRALKREGSQAASPRALSRQARQSARTRAKGRVRSSARARRSRAD